MELIDFYAMAFLASTMIGSLILFKRAIQNFELGKTKSSFEKFEELYEFLFPIEGTILGSLCAAFLICALILRFIPVHFIPFLSIFLVGALIAVYAIKTIEMRFKKLLLALATISLLGIILVKFGICTL